MKDKIDLLLEILDNPDRFSDSALEEILNDEEVNELYGLINKTKSSICDEGQSDLDAEWKAFSSHHQVESRKRGFSFKHIFSVRKAAIFGGIIATITAVGASIGFNYMGHSHSEDGLITEDGPTKTIINSSTEDRCDTILTFKNITPDTIIFKDENLENILSIISQYYGVKTRINNKKAKELRLFFKWDQSLELPMVIDQLNSFEHINISYSNQLIMIE